MNTPTREFDTNRERCHCVLVAPNMIEEAQERLHDFRCQAHTDGPDDPFCSECGVNRHRGAENRGWLVTTL